MKILAAVILVFAGLINLVPVTGVLSAGQLERLYGLPVQGDLAILMRHRAVLFGILGGFIVLSAFRPVLRPAACVTGLVSMLSFVALAFLANDYGPALHKVVVADLIASAGLLAVLLHWLTTRPG